jgi:DNA-directed RNA polymerase subunit F
VSHDLYVAEAKDIMHSEERRTRGMQQRDTHMTAEHYAHRIAQMLQDAQQECRIDIQHVKDAKVQAMFESIAEVLGGAIKTLDDYSGKREQVWQDEHAEPSTYPPQGQRLRHPVRTDLAAVDVDAAEPPPALYSEMPGHKKEV